VIELFGGGEELEVSFAHCADDELGDGRRPAPVPGLVGRVIAADFFGPEQGLEEFFGEGFLGSEFLQAVSVRGFEVDGDTAGEVHGAFNLGVLGAGHDFKVDVAFVLVFVADDVYSVEEFVLGTDAAACNTGAEEQAFDQSGAVHVHEGLRHLFGLVGGPAHIPPGAEGAVIAIAFAGGGEQGFEHLQPFTAGHDNFGNGDELALCRVERHVPHRLPVDDRGAGFFPVSIRFQVHVLGEDVQLLVHTLIIEHTSYEVNQ